LAQYNAVPERFEQAYACSEHGAAKLEFDKPESSEEIATVPVSGLCSTPSIHARSTPSSMAD
jgi:hypothetical protein